MCFNYLNWPAVFPVMAELYFCSSNICFWISSHRHRGTKSPLDSAEIAPDIMILQFLHHAFHRVNSICNTYSDF